MQLPYLWYSESVMDPAKTGFCDDGVQIFRIEVGMPWECTAMRWRMRPVRSASSIVPSRLMLIPPIGVAITCTPFLPLTFPVPTSQVSRHPYILYSFLPLHPPFETTYALTSLQAGYGPAQRSSSGNTTPCVVICTEIQSHCRRPC